jgi:hypothetical protein
MSVINTTALVEIVTSFGEAAIKEELVSSGVPAEGIPTEAAVAIVTKGITNLGPFTRLVSDLSGGTLAAKDITALMERAFPDLKIGEKHGPHYLSLARKGNYGELRHPPASKKRTKTQVVVDLKDLDEKALKALAKISPALKAAVEAFEAMPKADEVTAE